MLEKIAKIDFKVSPLPKVVEFDYNGSKIQVVPYFTMESKTILFIQYIQTLYDGILSMDNRTLITKYMEAEYSLKLAIIDLNTNIDINFDADTFNSVMEGGLWEKIENSLNYDELRWDLSALIDVICQKDKLTESVGAVLNSLVTKVIAFADSLPKDLNADQIQGSLSNFTNELSKLNTAVPGILNPPGEKTTGKKSKKEPLL
jgi:hypothetical protein